MADFPIKFEEMLKLRLKSSNPLQYETITLPPQLIANQSIAYGGYTTAIAVQSAFHSLPGNEAEKDKWSVYSITGLFLGPTVVNTLLQIEVQILRQTRSFATRLVTVSQIIKGQSRRCVCTTIDFTLKIPPSGPPHQEIRLPLCYSLSPHNKYPSPDTLDIFIDEITKRVENGLLKPSMKKFYLSLWGKYIQVVDLKMFKGDVLYETFMGLVPLSQSKVKTSEQKKHAHIADRRTADYFKSKEELRAVRPSSSNDDFLPMTSRSVQASFLMMVADGPISDIPLMEHGMGRLEAGALSTLDFAIRLHDDDYDFNQYHLREFRMYCAERERTFGEALIFNLDGKLIVSSTQQCIARPKKKDSRL